MILLSWNFLSSYSLPLSYHQAPAGQPARAATAAAASAGSPASASWCCWTAVGDGICAAAAAATAAATARGPASAAAAAASARGPASVGDGICASAAAAAAAAAPQRWLKASNRNGNLKWMCTILLRLELNELPSDERRTLSV